MGERCAGNVSRTISLIAPPKLMINSLALIAGHSSSDDKLSSWPCFNMLEEITKRRVNCQPAHGI